MERSTALALFESLEKERDTEYKGDPPTYGVRLDAIVEHSTEERGYRLRLTPGVGVWTRDTALYVLEQASEHDVEVDVQNSGIELQ